jgi:hypothetical protein
VLVPVFALALVLADLLAVLVLPGKPVPRGYSDGLGSLTLRAI